MSVIDLHMCTLCGYENNLKSVALAHVRECIKTKITDSVDSHKEAHAVEDNVTVECYRDFFWNYISGEFFVGSIFKLALNFEKYGNGLGMFIISKVMLPFIHSLGHSNYSNSIHRFISRILTSVTPREALLLIWERFSNKKGGRGRNIFKDRRLEFRIRKVAYIKEMYLYWFKVCYNATSQCRNPALFGMIIKDMIHRL